MSLTDRISAAFAAVTQRLAALHLNKMQVVFHQYYEDWPRPDCRAVYWVGTVEPKNAIPGDIWRAP